jgi:hypothetical protein
MTSKSSSSGLASSLITCLWYGKIGLCFRGRAEPEPEALRDSRGFSLNREDGAGDAMMRALDEVYNPVQASSGTQGYIPRIEWDVAIMLLDLMGMAVLISHASLLAIYETN